MSNSMRNRSGFAATSAGNDADRTKQGFSCNPLIVV
jgi:hypothetical protein